MGRGDGRGKGGGASGVDPMEQLFTVFDGKPFQNLSWRLLRLLVDGVKIEQREFGAGDALTITKKIDFIYVASGSLVLVSSSVAKDERDAVGPAAAPATIDAGELVGTWGLDLWADSKGARPPPDPVYRDARLVRPGRVYKATEHTLVYVFFKPKQRIDELTSRWGWLCRRSHVARSALHSREGEIAEVVWLTSLDLVEYLPALTELLAQAITRGDVPDDDLREGYAADEEDSSIVQNPVIPKLRVCLVRLDDTAASLAADAVVKGGKAPEGASWTPTAVEPLDIVLGSKDSILRKVEVAIEKRVPGTPRAFYDYVFVDPYDRASDLGTNSVKALSSRARVSDPGNPVAVNPNSPGSTLSVEVFEALAKLIDSVVHVSRNFRVDSRKDDASKLNFHAVVLDSRTARFESVGVHDRSQLRSADEPLRPPVDAPEAYDNAPTTRLHLNLLRLKKAWQESPSLDDVCDALDEPNIPRTGNQQGYWKAKGFFERWVRDLRFRRVGIALGGGGATGFAHVALLRQLRQRKVPIDLVSGTSFGALVGAYYCAHGLDGVEMLVQQGLLYTGVVSLTVLSSAILEHLVNLSIEYRPMWELPIPFYAVATDIEKGEPAIFPGPLAANPSVGFAVRASGALPGFFGPALAGDQRPVRYVDGGAVSIVPARALLRFGADVIIGSNAFPFRKNDATYSPTILGALIPPPFNRMAELAFQQFNPGNRMTDAARSLSLSLTPSMQRETSIASALYEHKRTDVKYWEFHRARRVIAAATEDLATSSALPAALNAVRLLNLP